MEKDAGRDQSDAETGQSVAREGQHVHVRTCSGGFVSRKLGPASRQKRADAIRHAIGRPVLPATPDRDAVVAHALLQILTLREVAPLGKSLEKTSTTASVDGGVGTALTGSAAVAVRGVLERGFLRKVLVCEAVRRAGCRDRFVACDVCIMETQPYHV